MKKVGVIAIALLVSIPVCATYDHTITGGYFYSLTLENYQTLLMTGGGGDLLTCKDFSVAEIKNTSSPLAVDVGGIWNLMISNYSKVSVSGGQIHWIDMGGNAKAILSGGQINNLRSYQTVGWLYGQPVGQHIEMVVKDYAYNTGTKKLTGHWVDNSTFDIQLVNQTGYDTVINNIKFTIIPEPATLFLLGLGGLLLRKRK